MCMNFCGDSIYLYHNNKHIDHSYKNNYKNIKVKRIQHRYEARINMKTYHNKITNQFNFYQDQICDKLGVLKYMLLVYDCLFMFLCFFFIQKR